MSFLFESPLEIMVRRCLIVQNVQLVATLECMGSHFRLLFHWQMLTRSGTEIVFFSGA
jgi:hypothetical protein